MITKKDFKELDIEKQVELVNQELKKAKGTKNFGKFDLDFSYGFARTILTSNNYETLDEIVIDGTKIKLFRKMNEDEISQKETKDLEKTKTNEIIPIKNDLFFNISNDMYLKNEKIAKDKKTISKNIPIFEDTYEEFLEILNSNEFKMYEKKYVIELIFRNFIDKYKN